jgi:hypothetical protein
MAESGSKVMAIDIVSRLWLWYIASTNSRFAKSLRKITALILISYL